MRTADTDGDGKIDRAEFIAYMLSDELLNSDGTFQVRLLVMGAPAPRVRSAGELLVGGSL